MGSTSITPGGVIAPTSPAEVTPPTSTARGGLSALESGVGGETALLPTVSRGGEAICASSAKASPTTVGSGDLMREGEDGAPRLPCGSVIALNGNHLVRISIGKIVSKRKNELSSIYLIMTGIRVFGLNTQGLIVAGILACTAAAVRCASKPRRRASSDVFCTNSHYLLAAGLSGLLAS
jgi:hypothetical protein